MKIQITKNIYLHPHIKLLSDLELKPTKFAKKQSSTQEKDEKLIKLQIIPPFFLSSKATMTSNFTLMSNSCPI